MRANNEITLRQREYLAFIGQYSELAEVPPSEGDIASYFGVSGPSAHQMVVALEAKGLIARLPGVPRSIRLLVSREVLPGLGAPGERVASRHAALAVFAHYLAGRLAQANIFALARFARLVRLSVRVEEALQAAGADRRTIKRSRKAVLAVARRLFRSRPKAGEVAPTPEVPDKAGRPMTAKRPTREVPPDQGSLF